MGINGFLLIDKDKDWTSRDVCNKISRLFNTKKVGHIGTLDPFATGLMIVALGEATKCLPYISDDKKRYITTLKLGEKTSTGDLTGNLVETKDIPLLNEEKIKDVLSSFLGKSKQTPPMCSAIHYNGQKLYTLYQQGIEVDVPSREIEIYDINFISYVNNEIKFDVLVSKGTYIRSLGEDIANKLETVGHLIELRRTQINEIDVENAFKIDQVDINNVTSINDMMINFLPLHMVDKKAALDVKNGIDLSLEINSEKVLIINEDKTPIAFYGKIDNSKYHCLRGLNIENN